MQYKELIDARTKKRITQAELADKIGVGRALISKYENGMIDPTITQIRKIAAALEVPVTQLLPPDADYLEGKEEDLSSEEKQKLNEKIEGVQKQIQGLSQQGLEQVKAFKESRLHHAFGQLNAKGQQIAVERVEELTKIPDYQKADEED